MAEHPADQHTTRSEPGWPQWLMLVVFVFIAFEAALLAVVFKGAWFVLLAPAAACGMKSIELWRSIKREG